MEQERKATERQTAMKVWIRDLVGGQYVANTGWEPNYVQSGAMRIARANIIGAVVQKSSSKVVNYDYLVLDDGTGRMMVRAFEKADALRDFQMGDLMNVIGKPREYANEIYLVPEITRKLEDPLWAEVRKRELAAIKPALPDSPVELPLAEERIAMPAAPDTEAVDDIVTPRDRLLAAIRQLDRGDGAEMGDVLGVVREEQAEKLLQSLLLRGDAFEIRPGRIKLLE